MSEMAVAKSYHHGNLRAELLDTAIRLLQESGVEDLSLRALARRLDVSISVRVVSKSDSRFASCLLARGSGDCFNDVFVGRCPRTGLIQHNNTGWQ